MKKQNQSLFHLMELPFLSAEVKSHIEPLFEGILKRWCRWWCAVNPQCGDTNCRGMPTESARLADVRFVQRLLQEDVDREVRAGHRHQHRELGLVLQ